MKNIIDAHNKSNLKQTSDQTKTCNCRDKTKCPLNGDCRKSGIVYQAEVRSEENQPRSTATQSEENQARSTTTESEENQARSTAKQTVEYYVGLTDTEFKTRLANHNQSFNKNSLKNATELSKYIWSLKSKNINYIINWKILGQASAYNNRTKKCNLCNLEKYFIICHPKKATLNQRCGLINSCRHFRKFCLANHPS